MIKTNCAGNEMGYSFNNADQGFINKETGCKMRYDLKDIKLIIKFTVVRNKF